MLLSKLMSAFQAALKSGVHRARFGVKQAPGLSQVTNCQARSSLTQFWFPVPVRAVGK